MKIIDLRSDTVTRPTPAMRAAIAAAEVGDDVYGEDPVANRLESIAADTIGTEAAIFVSSGTQSNLISLLSHCQRGDEYIVGQEAHTYKFEGGGAAILGSIQPQPLEMGKDGRLNLDKVAQAIKPDDFHFARTRLLCLENTHNGNVLPLDYIERARKFAKQRNLAMHLDGARVFNASVKLNVPITDITRFFNSISICLSKGLGAPVGSVLCGEKDFIKRARRWRKMLGGGMRQTGLLAAAGIIALRDNVQRLAEDHKNTRLLADGLSQIPELDIDTDQVETNMLFFSLDNQSALLLQTYLKENGVLISGRDRFRLVTHLDITEEDIRTVIHLFSTFFNATNTP